MRDLLARGGIRELVVVVLEHGAILAHALRQQLLHERAERVMLGAQRGEIAHGVEAAADLARIVVVVGQLTRHALELLEHRTLVLLGARPGAVEERLGKNDLEESFAVHVVRAGDHAKRGDDVGARRVLAQRATLRQPARDA